MFSLVTLRRKTLQFLTPEGIRNITQPPAEQQNESRQEYKTAHSHQRNKLKASTVKILKTSSPTDSKHTPKNTRPVTHQNDPPQHKG